MAIDREDFGGPRMTYRLRWTSLLLLILAASVMAVPALAADFRGNEANPEVTGTIDDDVYVVGQDINVPGDIAGELFAFGQKVTLGGSTGGPMTASGQEISISGAVGGTARIAGQDMSIRGTIDGDLMAAGQSVQIGSEGSVGNDLLSAAHQVEVAGSVGGDILGGMNKLTISGTVDGNVDVEVEELILGEGATISGDLIYTSANMVNVPDGANVAGRIVRRIPADAGLNEPLSILFSLLRNVAGTLLLGLVIAWLFPGFFPRVSSTVRQSPVLSFGAGIAGLILIPVVAILLIVAASLAAAAGSLPILLAVSYLVLLLLAKVIVAYTVGAVIVGTRTEDPRPGLGRAFLALLIGAVLLGGISLIPIAGGIADLLVILFAVGAVLVSLFRSRRTIPPSPEPAGRPATPDPKPVPAETSATAN